MKKRIFYNATLALALIGCASVANAEAPGSLYVYQGGHLKYALNESGADSIAVDKANGTFSIFDTNKQLLHTATAAEVDSVTLHYNKPVADLLDVRFRADGTAYDASPMNNEVQVFGPDNKVNIGWNETYGVYSGNFINNWGLGNMGDSPNYCKVDFSQNKPFQDALASGHTLETVFLCRYTGNIANEEAKWFAAHEAGGTGLFICRTAAGRGNEITFLPNISTNGNSTWRWVTSGIVPVPEVYYHVVGVWDKDKEECYIYVNGELCKTLSTPGEFHPAPNQAARWFGIGCDAGPNGGQFGGNWEIVSAKVYGRPLSKLDVETLYANCYNPANLTPQPKPEPGTEPEPEPEPQPEGLYADLLDIQINADGTATDISPMKNRVESHTGAISAIYSSAFNGFIARLDNVWAGSPSGYYKVNYETNKEFRDALSEGHTLEAIVSANYNGALSANNAEAKFLASHEAGGTGLMMCTSNASRGQELTFLPNVTTNGNSTWRWATSGVSPEVGVYYHIIGVYDKDAEKARVYVNGELKNEVDAPGTFRFATSGNVWFGIGCDAGPSAQLGWRGDIVRARVYGKALNADEIAQLSNEASQMIAKVQPDMVTNVKYFSGMSLKPGSVFNIKGSGFAQGDVIALAPGTDITDRTPLDYTLTEEGVDVTLPTDITTGSYHILVVRGANVQDLGTVSFTIVDKNPKGSQIISHRGFWNTPGSAQNSRTSVRKALELGVYGAEIDIWLTTDKELMINHDATFSGVTIQESTAATCKNLTLSNGEKMPTLSDIFDVVKDSDSTTKLILEIKEHNSVARNEEAARATVEAVKAAGLEDIVEYISFSTVACEKVIALDKNAIVSYLGGGKLPSDLYAKGYKGIDYHISEFRAHKDWIHDAKHLGMATNAWTINSAADICEMINLGVDFITTDIPVEALEIKAIYDRNAE